MSTRNASKVVLIHTLQNISSTCGELMRSSVVLAKSEDGCVDCELQNDSSDLGRWAIRGAWSNEESMRLSFEQIFQPAFERLIASKVLLSIKVCEDEEAPHLGSSEAAMYSPKFVH